MTLYDSILMKGKAEGKAEGIAEGQANGKVIGIELTLLVMKYLKQGDTPSDIAQNLDIKLEYVLSIKKELGL